MALLSSGHEAPRGAGGRATARLALLARLCLILGLLVAAAIWLVLTPEFLERHLSPDGRFNALTRARVAALRLATGWAGLTLLAAGLAGRWWVAPAAAWCTRHARGLQRAGLACAAAVLALLLGEVACRFDESLQPGDETRFDFSRYGKACIEDLRSRGQLDKHGYRELRFNARASPGLRRILFIGDSFVYGLGLPDNADTLPAALERALAAAAGRGPDAVPVQVLNAGVCGADTGREIEVLRELLPRVRPDLVLLGYYVNDAETDALKQDFYAHSAVIPLLSDQLLDHSALWRQVEPRLLGLLRKAGLRRTYLQHLAALHQPGAAIFERLAALEQTATAGGRRFAVVLIPMLDALAPYPLEETYATLRAHFAARGVPCLDLLDVFRGTEARDWQVSPVDHHLNAAGSARAAPAIAAWLAAGPLAPR